ncbi:MAG: class I adenylate-forming enzyme family protein [Acidimicrobiales bacterium]
MSLRPTVLPSAARAARYRRPGGPWSTGETLADLATHAVTDAAAGGSLEAPALEAAIAAVAGSIRDRGIGRGDVVAWQLPNGIEALLLLRACWRLGAIAAPVHHASGSADAAGALAQVDPALVVPPPSKGASPGVVGRIEDLLGRLRSGPRAVARDSASPGGGRPRATDLALVLFTSGSTGVPKAVLHTHRGLAWKARLMASVHALRDDDAVLMPAPLAHVSGLLNGVLLPGATRMRSVLMDRWDPERALGQIEDHRVSFMIGPPTFFVTLMDASGFTRDRVGSLRLVSSGGAGVTPAFVDRATATLDCTVKRTYGSTEAPTITTSHAGDPAARGRDTDGRPTGEVELFVEEVSEELWVRGPELFAGYADEAETASAHARGGWFRTGDQATIDGDGWLTVVGRLKDVIIRGGENIAAAEVESVLEAHPRVRQAVAVGAPHARLGEIVVAFVVADGAFDLDQCRAWFSERGVTRFKTPERVVTLDALPLLGAGKPDRSALAKRAAAIQGAG